MGPKLCRVVEYGEVKLQVEEGGGRVRLVREGERNGWEWKKEIKKERAKKRRNKGEGDVEEERKRGEGMNNGQEEKNIWRIVEGGRMGGIRKEGKDGWNREGK